MTDHAALREKVTGMVTVEHDSMAFSVCVLDRCVATFLDRRKAERVAAEFRDPIADALLALIEPLLREAGAMPGTTT